MFFELNLKLCEAYMGLDPIKLLDYPAEDVYELINGYLNYSRKNRKKTTNKNSGVIRKKAGDNWF